MSSELFSSSDSSEVNGIAAVGSAASATSSSFVTCSSDGAVRYYDTRMKGRAVITVSVPFKGDSDLLEIISHPRGQLMYTFAGSKIAAVEIRKGKTLMTNTLVDASLSSFDVALKTLPPSLRPRSVSDYFPLTVLDDDGEFHFLDSDTLQPLSTASTNSSGTSTQVAEDKEWKSFDGSSSITVSPRKYSKGSSSLFGSLPGLAMGFTSFVSPSIGNAPVFVSCDMTQSMNVYCSPPRPSTVADAATTGSKKKTVLGWDTPSTTVRVGGEFDAIAESATVNNCSGLAAPQRVLSQGVSTGTQGQTYNPPIPTTMAPFFGNSGTNDDLTLIAVGRADGSYCIYDLTNIDGAKEKEDEQENGDAYGDGEEHNNDNNKVSTATTSTAGWQWHTNVELAYVAQGHARNSLTCVLWTSVAGRSSNSSSSTPMPRKLLVTVAVSGEISVWDVTDEVAPAEEDNERAGEDDDDGDLPTIVAAGNARVSPSSRSKMNCSAMLKDDVVLSGTSHGEIVMTRLE